MSVSPASRIFVSYSHDDVSWQRRIVQRLRDLAEYRETSVFVDDGIPAGDDWAARLEREIRDSSVVLCLVSQSWIDSDNCKSELKLGLEHWDRENGSGVAHPPNPFRLIWASLDGVAVPSRLLDINSPGCTTPLAQLDDGPILDATIDQIARNVLAQLDPLWDPLQARLPRKYRLIRKLAEGSTSSVYLARDLSLERRVAIRAARNPEANAAFDAAIQRAVRVGRMTPFPSVLGAWLEKDPHCCVLDYLEGSSLSARLEEATFDWGVHDAIRLVLQIGAALVEIHGRGIHFRDLRPSKILIDDSRSAFICGLSKPDSAADRPIRHRLTNLSGEHVSYLVPEHFYPLGDSETPEHADQYLLGLIAYHVLTRKLPETVHRRDNEIKFLPLKSLDRMPELVPDCPAAFSNAISRMTSKHPGDRFPRLSDALDLIRDLQPIHLTLARESFARCCASPDFFETFYATFKGKSEVASKLFENLTERGWQRLYDLLREAVLMLFAYAATPPSQRGEPNVLSRIAVFHGRDGPLTVRTEWYDEFAKALVETVGQKDPLCQDERVRPHVESAWGASLGPGLRYMLSHAADGNDAFAGTRPTAATASELEALHARVVSRA